MEEPSATLVFAVSGRIGSGCSFVSDSLTHSLASYGYTVHQIKITDILGETGDNFTTEAARITALQQRGSALRKKNGNEALAIECVARCIVPLLRQFKYEGRHAFIIDSLKHRQEIRFLRRLFRQMFYLVGVVASDSKREERLRERKQLTEDEVRDLSEIDAGRRSEATQETVKAVTLADYFFKNDYATRKEMNAEADRLMRRIFDVGIDTPRVDEYGMHVAYQASLRSACLSRQVGAAIFSESGTLLSTGHNDVPRHGGGLYGMEPANDSTLIEDKRCWSFGGKCYNDIEKRVLAEEVCDQLIDAGLLQVANRDRAISSMFGSRIDQLIEFSRAVHAEMEAIISVARTASNGIISATLYCTTYPCHNCAKHIIDSGIKRVVYREPYEKSLARKLHSDVIRDSARGQTPDVVIFENYGGVGPQRFEEFFKSRQQRKNEDGSFIDRDRDRVSQIPPSAISRDFLRDRIERFAESDAASHEQTRSSGDEMVEVIA